ncbi:MAG: CPBP family intramembrane metalloprotease [Bacteroidaceae bacterium]|nr:CPBP family intramembrane metalloprotease [Bacteroidaceae bacterium]
MKDRKTNGLVDALVYLIVFVLVQLVTTYVVSIVWGIAEGKSAVEALAAIGKGDTAASVPALIVIQAVFSLVVMVLFLWKGWCRVTRTYLRTWPFAVLAWVTVAALGTVIPSEVFLELVPLPDLSGGALSQMLGSRWGYLAICIFAPLVEEMVFRGAILRALLGWADSHWVAIFISAVIFSAVHLNPVQMPHAFCLGLLLGWMYYRTGSIIPGIMLHWVNNTVAYVVYNLFPQYQDASIIDLLGGSEVKVALSVFFSLLIFVPAVVQLHLLMKRPPEA